MSMKINYSEIFGKSINKTTYKSELSVFFDKNIFEVKEPGPQPIPTPKNNEIWYTGEYYDMRTAIDQFIVPYSTHGINVTYKGPEILSNEFDGKKWIITFDEDVTATGILPNNDDNGMSIDVYPIFMDISTEMPSGVTCNINSVALSNSISTIAAYSFGGLQNNVSIKFPNNAFNLGEMFMVACPEITSLTIPTSLFSIEQRAILQCDKLSTIVVDQNNTKYDSRDNCNAIIETATNKLIEGCKDTIIPNSVTTIGQYSFRARETMTTMTIPSSVTSIEQSAFTECTGLTSIICLATVPPSLGSYAMSGSYPIYVPAESVDAYKAATGWSEYASRIQAIQEPQS